MQVDGDRIELIQGETFSIEPSPVKNAAGLPMEDILVAKFAYQQEGSVAVVDDMVIDNINSAVTYSIEPADTLLLDGLYRWEVRIRGGSGTDVIYRGTLVVIPGLIQEVI